MQRLKRGQDLFWTRASILPATRPGGASPTDKNDATPIERFYTDADVKITNRESREATEPVLQAPFVTVPASSPVQTSSTVALVVVMLSSCKVSSAE